MAAHAGQDLVMEVDDDDDIILIAEEDQAMGSDRNMTYNEESGGLKVCSEMKEQIKAAKDEIEVTENEIKLMSQELKSMESSIGEAVYERLKFLVDNPDCTVVLEGMDEDDVIEMISQELGAMNVVQDFSRSRSRVINEKLSSLEKANQSVSKMLLQCHTKLKAYGQALSEEAAIVSDEIEKYEDILSSSTINIDDEDADSDKNSSDDDVKIVDEPQSQNSSSPSKKQPQQAQGSRQNSSQGSEIPSMDTLRSQFASAVTSQMPGLLTSLNAAQGSNVTSSPVTPRPLDKGDDYVWPSLMVGDRVIAKKFNDVWYPGSIVEITYENSEWKCRVKFDLKGIKVLPGKHVAYRDSIHTILRIGTRVVARYKEEDAPSTLFAGVIAEAPSVKNIKRFLVFFDDGYAQYCFSTEIHKVYMQSKNVWEDIHPDTSSFIKEYLEIYPERPMVRLAKGQVIRTEWNGKWWTAKVGEIDASLVKMVFQSDRRTEWIYRGSTRLEPLFRALTNANAIKAAGSSKGRRHNLNARPSTSHSRPSVEYTRGTSQEDPSTSTSTSRPKPATATVSSTAKVPSTSKSQEPAPPKKKGNMAKKSTTGKPEPKDSPPKGSWQAPWLKYQRKATPEQKMTQMATQQSQAQAGQDPDQSSSTNKAILSAAATNKSDYASLLQERLTKSINQMEYDEEKAMGRRMDLRIDTKGRPRTNFVPHECGPACIKDIDDDPLKFRGQSPLLIPLHCSWERHVCKARPMAKRFVLYRAPCGRRLRSIEEVDKYLRMSDCNLSIDLFSFDHHLHVTTEFVPVKTFCDIKDMSYGKENYPVSCVNGIDRQYPDYLEYSHYRIPTKNVHLNLDPEFLACCDCTDNCMDRSKCACQRLTIENTSCIGPVDPSAGYHYRRLPEPLFTGIYECNSRCGCDSRCHNRVAQLGLRTKLQVFKTEKKGWGLRCLNDIAKGSFICIYAGQLLTDKSANEDGKQYGDEYLAELDYIEVVEGQKEGYESDVESSDDQDDKNYSASKDSEDSDFAPDTSLEGLEKRESSRRRKTKDSASEKPTASSTSTKETTDDNSKPEAKTDGAPIKISDEDNGSDNGRDKGDPKEPKDENKLKVTTADSKSREANNKTSPIGPEKGEVRRRARKSTGGSRLNLSISVKTQETIDEKDESRTEKRPPTRSFFKDNTDCYIMDAKTMGNLGRYLNHSCTPNVFVQNIFVDTHDLRFPWVSFFAGQHIRAGTELTWDYNYEVGSVPNKVLYCYCGSSLCRGRLL